MKNQLTLKLCYISLALHLFFILSISIGLQDNSPVRIFINGSLSSAKFVKAKHFKSLAIAGNVKKNKSFLAQNIKKVAVKKNVDAGKSLLKKYAELNFKDYRPSISKKVNTFVKELMPESKHKKNKIEVKVGIVKEKIKVEEVLKVAPEVEKGFKEKVSKDEQKPKESNNIVEPVKESIHDKEFIKDEVVVPQVVDAIVDIDVDSTVGDDSGVTIVTENVDFKTANRFSREFGKHLKAVKLYREFSLPVKFNVLDNGLIENVSFPQNIGTKVDQIAIIRALRQIDFNKNYPMLCGREMSLIFNRNEKGNISIGGGDNL